MDYKNIYYCINQFRIFIAYVLVKSSANYLTIKKDLDRWKELDGLSEKDYKAFGYLLLFKKEYRNLVSYRLKSKNKILSLFFEVLFRPMDTLYINTLNIGTGLYIQHGFSTIISAKSIGNNCYINQQVTIGFEGEYSPIIGNNVRICSGAKVIGGITVGDNSVIGANAVVVKNIPEGEIWGGVPAKYIKKADIN